MSEFAKRIHALYNEKQRALGNSVTEWDDLPDDFKYSNVRQARSISLKLEAIGCYTAVKPRNAADQAVERRTRIGADGREEDATFSDEEIEVMSRLEHDLWVDGAVGSIGEQAGSDLKKNRIIGGVSDTFTVVTAVMTVVTVLTVMMSVDQITEVVVDVTDPLNDASMQFSWYTFIKISMIIMINSAAILVLRRGELRYTRANQAEASAVLFDSARSKLNATHHTSNRRATMSKMAVLHELGIFSIQESADFAVDSLEAGEAKRPTLLNSRNRIKDGEEGDAYKAATDFMK